MTLHPAPFFPEVADGPEGGAAHWLTCADGVRIRIAHWRAEQEKGTILMFPGRTEYAEKYGRAATAYGKRGYAMVAIDWRGQGLADRLIPDRDAGYVEKFSDYQVDIAAVLEAAEALDLPKPYFMIAHSMGGCIGLRAAMSGLPINAAMFSAPMWGIQLSALMRPTAWAVSWASKQVGSSAKLTPGTKAKTYVLAEPFEGNTLTHDPDMYRYMQVQMEQVPEMALGGPSMHWLHEALVETRDLAARAAPELPAITFLGTDEKIVDPARIHQRMETWPNGELVMVEGAEHEVMMELPEIRDAIYDQSAAFFDQHLSNGTTHRESA
ncbi:alpha/beta hydrolase [Pelagimonas sp. KU-00592-HH]|uniref:alpha/beta hydrolase n=1 Tax=Pelagimonas sp. KU-00592-HH TaxID=3127651 RepID=UPI0031088DC9